METLTQHRLKKPGMGHAFALKNIFLVIILLMYLPLYAQKMELYPSKPEPGEILHLKYQPVGGTLQNENNISCEAILFRGLMSDKVAIRLKKEGDVFVGEFASPKDIQLIAFKLSNGQRVDDKSFNYQFPFFDKEGPVVGAKYAQASLVAGEPDMFFYGFKMSDYNTAFQLIKLEKKDKIEAPFQVAIQKFYYQIFLNVDSALAKKEIIARLKELKKQQRTEKNYILSYWLNRALNQQADAQDDLSGLAKYFPNSIMFFSKRYAEIGSARSGATMEQLYLKLVADYKDNPEAVNLLNGFTLGFFRPLADAFGRDFNLSKFYDYLSSDTSNVYKGVSTYKLADYLSSKDTLLTEAENIALQSLKFFELAGNQKPLEIRETSLRNWIAKSKNSYGFILLQQKKYKPALTLFKSLITEHQNPDIILQARYGIALAKNKQYLAALPFLEKALAGGYNELMLDDIFKETYFAIGGDEFNYQKKLEELFEIANHDKKFRLATIMLNEPIKNFSLLNINGEKVELADFKGKTVVIDFWATWCIPCKQSFPGMQKLVDKYNKKDVVFLFVNTLEKNRANLKDEIKRYMTENKFSFGIIMDQPLINQPDAFEMSKELKVKALPTKLVIDRLGNIRFRTTSYAGSDEAVVKELSEQIDQLNK